MSGGEAAPARRDRRGAKWADVPDGAIAASVADMELSPPDEVLRVAQQELTRPSGYPSSAEIDGLVRAGVDWTRWAHGLELDADRCLPVSSVASAAAWVLVRTTAPGDGVVRVAPTYPPLVDAVRSCEREDRPVPVAGGPASGWRLDVDALDRACDGARLLLWVAPHNPTGRVWSRQEVAAVAEIAASHGLTVVADEVWADVVLADRRHVPFADVAREVDPELAERTLTFVTTTKPWNLASLGCGLVHAGSPALHERLRGGGHVPMLPTPGRVALAVGTAAWRHGHDWLEDTLDHLRTVVSDAVERLRGAYGAARVTVPEGTYTLWLDLHGLTPGDEPMAVLAVPGGVVPTDGATYGAPGFVRLNLATTAAEAAAIVDRVVTLVPPPD